MTFFGKVFRCFFFELGVWGFGKARFPLFKLTLTTFPFQAPAPFTSPPNQGRKDAIEFWS